MYDSCGEIAPDSFTGAILALEGVRDAMTLLNGPTGCKFYHGGRSESQFPRAESFDPLQYAEEFYFGQPRVPSTYLDSEDYVFGTSSKRERILQAIAGKGHRMIAVVNSPGAALIGDDLERFITASGLDVPCIALENTGFAQSMASGYQKAALVILERLAEPVRRTTETTGKRVNLVGMSIGHRYWLGDLEELSRLLALCGITVGCAVCAGCTVAELSSLSHAACNAVVHEEYADEIAPWLEERYGLKNVITGTGAPVGFEATETWICKVCQALGIEPEPALRDIDSHRKLAYSALSRFNSLTGLPKGATFAIRADASLALPLTGWLHDYLGMVPISVKLTQDSGCLGSSLQQYLVAIGCGDAWKLPLEASAPDIVLADSALIVKMKNKGLPVTGIELDWPGSGRIEIIPRPLVGGTGALHLLEKILNGLETQCTR